MRILYDHQIFSYQKYGGISRYFSELYREFSTMDGIEIQLGFEKSVNHYLNELLSGRNSNIEQVDTSNLLHKYFIYKSNRKFCIKLLKENKFDVLHSTFYDPYTITHNKRPHIVTIHDMTPELYPEYYSGTLYSYLISKKWIQGKKELVAKADKIIAISNNTKKDIMEIYNTPARKIDVIYHGYNELPTPSGKLIPEPYILYVGLRNKYKNFKTFVDGITPILKKEKIKALCIGGGAFTKKEVTLLKENNLEDYFIQMSVNESGLASAYTHALCFIFPSEYEGFGMPILEAFSCGCPVVLNNASCFPEIAKDAALYFNNKNLDEMRSAIKIVLDSAFEKKILLEKAQKQLERFSWTSTARQVYDLYKS